MSSAAMSRAFWALFAGLLAAGGYLFLTACDLGIAPLFGLRYCKVEASSRELENAKAYQRALLARLGEAQLRLALLPTCQPPPKLIEKPQESLLPLQKNVEKPQESSPDALGPIKRKEELEGCWQSVRGDLEFYSDDEKHEYVGSARICYCFGKNGKGVVRQIFTEGPDAPSMCKTKLWAKLNPGELLIQHPKIPCTKGRPVNPATIVCRSQPDEAASCIMTYHGKFKDNTSQEQFQRVANEHCQWQSGR
jgi:hypothetical protein